jgi:hypothetical protein
MSDRPSKREPQRLADPKLIQAALQRAGREALLQHARAGNPVSVLRDGKVVWIPPEEILARFAAPPAAG